MSQYTTEIRYICEMNSGFRPDQVGTKTPDQIIKASRARIFNFDYPIYDADHKPDLECSILRHYYTREIAAETVELWKLWLNDRLNLIMPKYNKLYQAEKELSEKLFTNVNIHTDFNENSSSTHESSYEREESASHSSESSGQTKDRFSDTPQGGINFADADTGNVWLTTYDRRDDSTETASEDSLTQSHDGAEQSNSLHDSHNHEVGYRGGKTYYEMLSDYNDKVLDIDTMIVEELSDLFMCIW